MADERSIHVIRDGLLAINAKKEAAVHEQKFDVAAELRGKERQLQQELERAGGPPCGCYRITIEGPLGTYSVATATSIADALPLVGIQSVADVSQEIDVVYRATVVLMKHWMEGRKSCG